MNASSCFIIISLLSQSQSYLPLCGFRKPRVSLMSTTELPNKTARLRNINISSIFKRGYLQYTTLSTSQWITCNNYILPEWRPQKKPVSVETSPSALTYAGSCGSSLISAFGPELSPTPLWRDTTPELHSDKSDESDEEDSDQESLRTIIVPRRDDGRPIVPFSIEGMYKTARMKAVEGDEKLNSP